MGRRFFWLPATLVSLTMLRTRSRAGEVDFVSDVQPIFRQQCYDSQGRRSR